MEYGINNLIKNFSLIGIARNFKRIRDLRIYKKNKLRLPINYGIVNTNFGRHNYIGENVTIINSAIGDFSYINSNTSIRNTTIGKFCSIAENVKIVLGNHPVNFVSTHPAFYSNNKPFKTFSDNTYVEEIKNVIIGNDVWIGEGVLILGGVVIGNGAIIAARAVVTKDVEPYSIVGGVPAKHIKYRFNKEIIKQINTLEWWNWEESIFEENFKLFQDPIKFKEFFLKAN